MDTMVSPLQADDDFESRGIDLEKDAQQKDDEFENAGFDLETEAAKAKEEPSWLETIGDIFTQTGRGALKVFTWPADVLKLGMIGEGLSDIDELEESFQRAGKPFDREKYVRDVFEASRFIPTQELAEKGFEEVTGISLEPKTKLGKGAKQLAEVAAFTPGGLAKKAISGTIAAGTTAALRGAGVGEGKAEVIGDIASLSPAIIEKAPRLLSKAGQELEKTSQKYGLPFLEFMVKEKEPIVKGRLFKATEQRLKNSFDISSKEALNQIVRNELPVKRLQDRGVNLDALGEHAYDVTRQMAKAKPKTIKTDDIVKNIDNEISRIESLAPSPSDAQKTAIKLLEDERDILKVANPSSEQLINQHMNYNADMKSIYKKPQFSGKEEQVRKTYEFLKDELVNAMEKQGNKDVANAFRGANKIYHEKSKLAQTESLLSKAFKGDTYSPEKLDKLLKSKQGNFLRRNMSPQGIKDLEEIAKYGKEAEKKMANFIDLRNPVVANEVKSWGQLAPFVFLPHNLKGAMLAFAKPMAKHVQGKLLTRPATREVYKLTLKHAADGSYNLLKKDFAKLQNLINQEYGSVDNFVDDVMEELEIFNGEWD
jgi:hypothetical protein